MDLTHADLMSSVSDELQTKYLSEVDGPRPPPYTGRLWNCVAHRPVVWLPCKIRDVVVCVIFLVDTGSPTTKLCRQALEALKLERTPAKVHVSVNGTTLDVELSDGNNILGTDFLRATQSTLICDYRSCTCEVRPLLVHGDM